MRGAISVLSPIVISPPTSSPSLASLVCHDAATPLRHIVLRLLVPIPLVDKQRTRDYRRDVVPQSGCEWRVVLVWCVVVAFVVADGGGEGEDCGGGGGKGGEEAQGRGRAQPAGSASFAIGYFTRCVNYGIYCCSSLCRYMQHWCIYVRGILCIYLFSVASIRTRYTNHYTVSIILCKCSVHLFMRSSVLCTVYGRVARC